MNLTRLNRKDMNHIPIFFTFNDSYTVPAAVAFWSLLNKAKRGVFYEMYVLHSDITPDNQRLLLNVINRFKNGRLSFINTDGFLQKEWAGGNWEGHNARQQFTADTLTRCFAARFLPQYDKIIYSDVDVVFTEDISELIDVNLEDKYMAGVRNVFMKWEKNELSHLKPEHYALLKDSYIAGGIWVLNLQKIREDKLEDKMMSVVRDDTIVKRWNDQDIVNIACGGKVKFLPLNYISYPYLRHRMQTQGFVSHYTRDELYDSLINPKIIHYAGLKPWNNRCGRSEEWWNIYDYLRLPHTHIFKEPEALAPLRKVKKYKKICTILASLLIALVAGGGVYLLTR